MASFLKGSKENPPSLRLDISFLNLVDLPAWSTGPQGTDEHKLQVIKEAGYKGVQGADPELTIKAGLIPTAMANIQQVGIVYNVAADLQQKGVECLTLHLGSGFEGPDMAASLFEDVLSASEKLNFPIYVETHRATLTQDIWRCVELIKQFPEVGLNIDYSHWYSGLEMPNGNWDFKMEFIQPVFDRARYVHGRIGNSSHMQVDVGDGTGRPYVDHFRDMWTRTFRAFLSQAEPGDVLPFCPELLWPGIYYAREFPDANGNLREETDRWEQAGVLVKIAQECFEEARQQIEQSKVKASQ